VAGAVDSLFETASDAAESVRDYLGSEEGRRLRRQVATVVILTAPLIAGLPLVRRSIAGRFLRTAAIGALLVKGAEWLRDWEPARRLEPIPR
jgi:hypothetical protein